MQVLLLIGNPVVRYIPRIIFTVQHFPGCDIIRTQFPLLLSYDKKQMLAMKVFHMSKNMQHFSRSAIFCNESDYVVDDEPTFVNIVYDELMEDDNYELLENNHDDELMDIETDN